MQTISLIATEIERQGIPTTSVSLLEDITKTIKPPRALFVPFDLGYPLGEPHNKELQHKVIESALNLLHRNDTPVFEKFALSEAA